MVFANPGIAVVYQPGNRPLSPRSRTSMKVTNCNPVNILKIVLKLISYDGRAATCLRGNRILGHNDGFTGPRPDPVCRSAHCGSCSFFARHLYSLWRRPSGIAREPMLLLFYHPREGEMIEGRVRRVRAGGKPVQGTSVMPR